MASRCSTSFRKVPAVTVGFWIVKIAAIMLGATVGDFLDKPIAHGGLAFSRQLASLVIAVFIVGCLLVLPQKPGQHPQLSKEIPGT